MTAPITSGQNPAPEIRAPIVTSAGKSLSKLVSMEVPTPIAVDITPKPSTAPPIRIALVACVEDVQQRRVIAQAKIMLFLKIRFFMIIL